MTSILDKATNDAINAIIDLHREDKGRCAHCTLIAQSFAGDIALDVVRVWFPCPTMAALTHIAELTGVRQHVAGATPEQLIAQTALGKQASQ